MAKRKKSAVRNRHGIMCNICGVNCGKGGALSTHVLGVHRIKYDTYKKAFYSKAKNILADAWDDSVSTRSGKTVLIHTLVRRFVGDPGPRGVPRSARVKGI
jgi:hypothetical protein